MNTPPAISVPRQGEIKICLRRRRPTYESLEGPDCIPPTDRRSIAEVGCKSGSRPRKECTRKYGRSNSAADGAATEITASESDHDFNDSDHFAEGNVLSEEVLSSSFRSIVSVERNLRVDELASRLIDFSKRHDDAPKNRNFDRSEPSLGSPRPPPRGLKSPPSTPAPPVRSRCRPVESPPARPKMLKRVSCPVSSGKRISQNENEHSSEDLMNSTTSIGQYTSRPVRVHQFVDDDEPEPHRHATPSLPKLGLPKLHNRYKDECTSNVSSSTRHSDTSKSSKASSFLGRRASVCQTSSSQLSPFVEQSNPESNDGKLKGIKTQLVNICKKGKSSIRSTSAGRGLRNHAESESTENRRQERRPSSVGRRARIHDDPSNFDRQESTENRRQERRSSSVGRRAKIHNDPSNFDRQIPEKNLNESEHDLTQKSTFEDRLDGLSSLHRKPSRTSSRSRGGASVNSGPALCSDVRPGTVSLDKSSDVVKRKKEKAKRATSSNHKPKNDSKPSFDKKSGRCTRHPSVIVARKQMRGKGWDIIRNCPHCHESEMKKMNASCQSFDSSQDISNTFDFSEVEALNEGRPSEKNKEKAPRRKKKPAKEFEHDELCPSVSKMPYTTPWGESGWYTGDINSDGKPHGQGRMRFKTGNSYEGEWIDGYSDVYLENNKRIKSGFGSNVAPWKQNDRPEAPSTNRRQASYSAEMHPPTGGVQPSQEWMPMQYPAPYGGSYPQANNQYFQQQGMMMASPQVWANQSWYG